MSRSSTTGPRMVWLLLLGCVVLLSVPAWLAGPALWAAWQRHRLTRPPFPAAWRAVLRRRMPLYRRLPPGLQQQLRRHVQVFVGQVPFVGCQGQVVTDEVRVLVAAQAALLLLGRPAGTYRGLRQVLVYPAPFVVQRPSADGTVVHEQRRVLLGESWQQGQLILSWPDVLAGAADPDDGHNLVIHECAHQLDQERGAANGAPFLGRREAYARWADTWQAAFDALREQLAQGLPTLIDAYGATDPAEFFAVVSELFFERPAALAEMHPALYEELQRFFRCNPLSW